MALAAVQTAMNPETNSIHPFFAKLNRIDDVDSTLPITEASAENPHDDPNYEHPETVAPKGGKKRGRKPGILKDKGKKSTSKSNQASLDQFARRSQTEDPVTRDALEESPQAKSLTVHRSKRRKTASPDATLDEALEASCAQPAERLDWLRQLETEAGKQDLPHTASTSKTAAPPRPADREILRPMTPPDQAVNTAKPDVVTETTVRAPETRKTTPNKTLKVNKNGKLILPRPSKPTPKAETETSPPKKRRGRKPKGKMPPTVTIIRYGSNTESRRALGMKIESILSRTRAVTRPVTSKNTPPKPTGPPKATHPFFLGKAAPKKDEPVADATKQDAQLPSPRVHRKSAVTPGKLKAESRSQHAPAQASGPMFGSNRAPRQTGQDESPWPTRETAHVRNVDSNLLPPLQPAMQTSLLRIRKLKGNVPTIPKDQDVIERLAVQLSDVICAPAEPSISDFEPPKGVRLPTRLLTTGVNIQGHVRGQVGSTIPTRTGSATGSGNLHPAVEHLFNEIEHTLTPFDLATCESQTWTHKYAPKNASHLLQPGREAATLHDWLTNLTVMAVGGKADSSKGGGEMKKPPKKKRKKEQDDFIVDSDEEEEEDMIELDNGPQNKFSNMSPVQPISFRRPQWTRSKNVVLISGTHGCGKSAMVYAVAKDLGFEVFEINSGSRRSGKDIQDKVGDMSENHLVNHKRNTTTDQHNTVTPEDTDSERHSTALLKDLESGRQGTMTSFFKGAVGGKAGPEPKPQSKPSAPRTAPTSAQATLPIAQAQTKSQKQSLILFEEADVLFEEDQQFWAHVTRLAAQSKRPIIVTCNDETRVPTHELPLAAILRLSPPPIDLATDYMLVLAGREGHVLERGAVSSLYRSKDCDLRASITELDFWCQMSVGDRKGGLEWMYQRWPPGNDIDEHGQTLRVASQKTYQAGMGMLSHNVFESSKNVAFDREQELLKEMWENWRIEPSGWTEFGNESEAATLKSLERLDALSEAISATDIYCRIDMPSYESHHIQPTDPTLPPIPDKERLSYIIAGPVIQVDHVSDFAQFDTDIFTQSHLCIHRAYGGRHIKNSEDRHAIPRTERDFAEVILQHKQDARSKRTIARPDFSEAFDLLAYPPDTMPAMNTSYSLSASSFDRTFNIVVEDLAPYVRSIVAHELILEGQRLRLGSLLSEGGNSNKRQRTTRAARTALEGGNRQTKRRERWFDQHLNRVLVMETAGKDWTGMGSNAGVGVEDTEGSERTGESAPGTQEE